MRSNCLEQQAVAWGPPGEGRSDATRWADQGRCWDRGPHIVVVSTLADSAHLRPVLRTGGASVRDTGREDGTSLVPYHVLTSGHPWLV